MLGTQYFQEEMLCSTNVARFRCILFDFHHGGRPFPLHSHNHVGVVAADITVEDAAVRIDEMVMMFQPEMLEDLVHRPRFVAIEFGALDRFEGANLFMISAMFVGHRLAAAFFGIGALHVELLGDHLSKLGRYVDHFLMALATLGLEIEAQPALHMTVETLQYGRKEKTVAIGTFQHVLQPIHVEIDRSTIGIDIGIEVTAGDSLCMTVSFLIRRGNVINTICLTLIIIVTLAILMKRVHVTVAADHHRRRGGIEVARASRMASVKQAALEKILHE